MSVGLSEIRSLMAENISKELEIEVKSIDPDVNFQELGLDSISSMFMINELEDRYGIQIKALHLIEYPTLNTFSAFVHTLIHENK